MERNMAKQQLTTKQLEIRARHVLRRNGLKAGKAYAVKHNFTISAADLKSAALWWERAKHRSDVKKELVPNGTHSNRRRAWKLYQLRMQEANRGEGG